MGTWSLSQEVDEYQSTPDKRMKQIQAPRYWEVIHAEMQPMRNDKEFVIQFKKGFLY